MKLKVKRSFNLLFVVLVALWATLWLVVFPWGMRRGAEQIQTGNIPRECYADGNSPTQAEDCLKSYNELYRGEMATWKFPDLYWHARLAILVWVVFFPFDLYIFCRVLAIYFVWAHPYINFDGGPARRSGATKRKEAVLFTVWGGTIFCVTAGLPRLSIVGRLAKIIAAILPDWAMKFLEASGMGLWTVLLIGIALGAMLGLALWRLIDSAEHSR